MTFTIHRGATEIGGSCVEICAAKTRLVIDIGLPLENTEGSTPEEKLPPIPALFNNPDDKETALLISHAHQDHYGLVSFVDKKIPVYAGKASHALIELTAVFAGKAKPIENPRYFETNQPFTFGDFEITPYLMDHAACDAYAFLVCAEGKSLLYTGDFRAHGRKWKWFYKFLHIAPKNVDWLLMEGTTLSRPEQRFQTEGQLEEHFVKTFKETRGINLVYVSGQNIDRLVTVFRACKQCGKMFVIDFYIAAVLSELAALGYGVPRPGPGFPQIKVFFPNRLRKKMENLNRNDMIERFREYEITPEEIDEKAARIVMTVRPSMDYEIKGLEHIRGGTLVYSMWEGYKENKNTEQFLASLTKRGAVITTIHTSGHADHYALRKMIDAISPKELVPIHTSEGKRYQDIFPEANVKQVTNGEIVSEKQNVDSEVKETTLFDHIEAIAQAHENSSLMPDSGFENFVKDNHPHIEFVCDKLNITANQAILFSDLVSLFDGFEISLKDLSEFIGCKPISIIKHFDILESLDDKNLIRINKLPARERFETRLSFNIEPEILDALRKNITPDNNIYAAPDFDGFMTQLAKLCENRVQGKSKYPQAIQKQNILLENYKHLDIVKKIKLYHLSSDDALVLLRFCHYLVDLDKDEMSFESIRVIYDNVSDFRTAKQQLKAGTHTLQKKGLIQNVNEGGFGNAESFCLTEKAKDELLSEIEEQLVKKIKEIKPADEIAEKKLFYPEKTARQIEELTSLLQADNFASIQKRLSGESMRIGFACLFSGAPGTGKTETVWQIARKTGRGIMQVDIADTKSMWFGESEKKIKEFFTRYRAAVKHSKTVPILLFNEADAVIGKRQSLGENRNGPAQTENAIQNIILQEIENLNGILIATTNLTKNMDKAFERRFLYKIEFEKPSLEARKSIWQSLIPGLSQNEIEALSAQFNFSGGQIENIARRRTVAEVLYGSPPSLDKLVEYCKEEMADNAESRKIGFI